MDLEQDVWVNNQLDSMDIDGNVQTFGQQYDNIFLIAFISPSAEPEEEPGACKKAVMCFCGLEQNKAVKLTEEEEEELQRKLTDTSEKPLWRNVVNANALILLAVAFFCHGYFA